MKNNMGWTDRIIRLLAVAGIAYLYFTKTLTGTWMYVLMAFGVVFLITSLIGSCPAYSLFGINTCSVKKDVKANS